MSNKKVVAVCATTFDYLVSNFKLSFSQDTITVWVDFTVSLKIISAISSSIYF